MGGNESVLSGINGCGCNDNKLFCTKEMGHTLSQSIALSGLQIHEIKEKAKNSSELESEEGERYLSTGIYESRSTKMNKHYDYFNESPKKSTSPFRPDSDSYQKNINENEKNDDKNKEDEDDDFQIIFYKRKKEKKYGIMKKITEIKEEKNEDEDYNHQHLETDDVVDNYEPTYGNEDEKDNLSNENDDINLQNYSFSNPLYSINKVYDSDLYNNQSDNKYNNEYDNQSDHESDDYNYNIYPKQKKYVQPYEETAKNQEEYVNTKYDDFIKNIKAIRILEKNKYNEPKSARIEEDKQCEYYQQQFGENDYFFTPSRHTVNYPNYNYNQQQLYSNNQYNYYK